MTHSLLNESIAFSIKQELCKWYEIQHGLCLIAAYGLACVPRWRKEFEGFERFGSSARLELIGQDQHSYEKHSHKKIDYERDSVYVEAVNNF
jgi:hypothetical protein